MRIDTNNKPLPESLAAASRDELLEVLQDVFLAGEEYLKLNLLGKERIQKQQDRIHKILSRSLTLTSEQKDNKSLATQEEITTFKPLSAERMTLHLKPLSGNPGLPLELIRERQEQTKDISTAIGISTEYKKGDRVMHPIKLDWGVGQVLSNSSNGTVKILFVNAGEKTISLSHIQPLKVYGDEATSVVLDDLRNLPKQENATPLCKNCGQKTQFGERSTSGRVNRGWCNSCYKYSQQTSEIKTTGEVLYPDDYRTIDGVRTWYSPK